MIEAWLVILSLACLGLIFREFLPGYLREKGKNIATHEDIDRIVEQLKKPPRLPRPSRRTSQAGCGSSRVAGRSAPKSTRRCLRASVIRHRGFGS